jgi:hypothetical protein
MNTCKYIKLLTCYHLLHRRSYTDLSETLLRRLGFHYRPAHLGFVLSKVALEQISEPSTSASTVGTFRPVLHIHSLSDASTIDS